MDETIIIEGLTKVLNRITRDNMRNSVRQMIATAAVELVKNVKTDADELKIHNDLCIAADRIIFLVESTKEIKEDE